MFGLFHGLYYLLLFSSEHVLLSRRSKQTVKHNVFSRFHFIVITGFISSYKIIVRVIYIILLSVMPTEETGETRVKTDKHEMGDQILNVGQGTTGPPWRRTVFIVRIRVYFGVQSEFIWNHWMGALHVTVAHRHLSRQCSETVTLLVAVNHV